MSDNCGQDGVCAEAPGCSRHWAERVREVMAERDEARANFANACDVGRRQQTRAEKAERERDELRKKAEVLLNERRQLRARLVECRPWVGCCPFPNTPAFDELIAIRAIADDTLEEVKP